MKSNPETLQATLCATVSEAATQCNYPIARNVACNVASCGRAFSLSLCQFNGCTTMPDCNYKFLNANVNVNIDIN